MTEHILKTWPIYFNAMWDRRKRFEVRVNDREFRSGELLRLHEYDPETERYSGRFIKARIGYMMTAPHLPELLGTDVVVIQLEQMRNGDVCGLVQWRGM